MKYITQKEFAERWQVSLSTVNYYIREKQLDITEIANKVVIKCNAKYNNFIIEKKPRKKKNDG